MNAIIYCRVSSKEQAEGTSLESQQIACEDFARAKNMQVLGVFIEEGESAKFADRTELLKLIEFCRERKGKVQALLVWKVDRFARNVADHFHVKAILAKYGVQIVSVTEPIDANPEGRLMETILAGFAQFDNDIRATRTIQGMRRKILEGIFPWKPPLGYKTQREGREKKNHPDQPDEPLFGMLKKAWKEFATGLYSNAEIRRRMEIWGVVNNRGKPLSPQGVDNLFRNPFYAGILIDPWSGDEHQGLHVALVSSEDFARVQQIVSGRNRSLPHERIRPESPLRGLVRCKQCQRYLTSGFSRGRSRRYAYYHCHLRGCNARGKSLRLADVDSEFKAFLATVAPKEALLEKLGQVITRSADKQEEAAKAWRDRSKKTLDNLNSELRELIRMRSQNLIDDDEFTKGRSILLDRRHVLQTNPGERGFVAAEIKERLNEITQPLHELLQTWNALPPRSQARFQHLILPMGFVTGTIRTAELGLLFRTIGGLDDVKTTWVHFDHDSLNQICKEIKDFFEVLTDADPPKTLLPKRVQRRSRE